MMQTMLARANISVSEYRLERKQSCADAGLLWLRLISKSEYRMTETRKKAEIRTPKMASIGRRKKCSPATTNPLGLRASGFGFLSDPGFRISDFEWLKRGLTMFAALFFGLLALAPSTLALQVVHPQVVNVTPTAVITGAQLIKGQLLAARTKRRVANRGYWFSPCEANLRYNENVIVPGAQTERPGDAGPVRAKLGGWTSPADFAFRDFGEPGRVSAGWTVADTRR